MNFLLRYIHCMGGLIVTMLVRLILYVSYIVPIISPPLLPPWPTMFYIIWTIQMQKS
jgi:hypothetical protein